MPQRHSTVDMKNKDDFRQFTENLDETAKAQQEARGILSKYLGKLRLTGVLVCCHGKVSPDKHKSAQHKYGSERSREAH